MERNNTGKQREIYREILENTETYREIYTEIQEYTEKYSEIYRGIPEDPEKLQRNIYRNIGKYREIQRNTGRS